MALSGFFLIEFSALKAGPGGFLTIDGRNIRGSDGDYLFAGVIEYAGNEATVNVRAMPVSKYAESVFGTVGYAFDLVLSGSMTDGGFFVFGPSPITGGPSISIKGTKVAELDLIERPKQ